LLGSERDNAKKAGKTSENRLFCLVQSVHLGTTGVSVLCTEHQGDEDGGNIMLRIGTGAPHGLRLGVCGFAAAVFTLASNPSQGAPYADIVVDANSGNVLHETNADARRHPASLTKIMTLYLLFEQLEAGKLKLDSQLHVSKEAAGQMPTKLGLKPGSTIQVEDAIKGIVTRSANDAAVVVGEAIAGNEDEFAKLMTRKAQALGMTRTVYKNASGLPDDDQVTTARDQTTLGRAIQERFPRYYKYFSTRSFTFRGQSIGNHNHLLGRVEGVDGIKTGYISASGFNLVTSLHRGNRYLVAVVMGGSSAGSRDARMRELISDKIAHASTKRTAPMIAEVGQASDVKGEPKALAKSEAKAEAKRAAKVEPKTESKPETKREQKAEPKAEPRFAVASAVSLPARLNQSAGQAEPTATRQDPAATTATATAEPSIAVGSTDPIRPVLVKTLTVRAGTQTASLAPLHVSSLPATEPVEAAQPVSPSATAAKIEPPAVPAPRATAALPARTGATEPAPAAAAKAPAVQAPSVQSSAAPAPRPHVRSGWIIQVGSYQAEREAKQRLSAVRSKASKMLTGADPFTETFDKGGTTYYRARFAGLDKDKAEAACKYLKRNDVECVTIKN
jgi:D-alanyl-D-alanine carboxypeptidase